MRVTLALLIAAVLIAILCVGCAQRPQRSGFVSQRARDIYARSRDLFDRSQGGARFTDYKKMIPDADAVLYTDARRSWHAGALTPEYIQSILGQTR